MSKFVYVTYIRTTPEKLWEALVTPEFTKQYWMGVSQISDWKVGSPWKLVFEDGRIADTGQVLEVDPPRRLVVSWQNEFRPELKEEGHSRATFDIENAGTVVKLTITHEIDKEGSKLILKTLLETGKALEGWRS
jgi:uncharacterized protein YndB with AHSA1/START domain